MTQRAKTTPASTPGSFAPHERSTAETTLTPVEHPSLSAYTRDERKAIANLERAMDVARHNVNRRALRELLGTTGLAVFSRDSGEDPHLLHVIRSGGLEDLEPEGLDADVLDEVNALGAEGVDWDDVEPHGGWEEFQLDLSVEPEASGAYVMFAENLAHRNALANSLNDLDGRIQTIVDTSEIQYRLDEELDDDELAEAIRVFGSSRVAAEAIADSAQWYQTMEEAAVEVHASLTARVSNVLSELLEEQ